MPQKVLRTLGQSTKLPLLTAEEQFAGQNVMQNCMAVQATEKVLIVTDPGKFQNEARIFFESAKKVTNQVTLVEMETATENAQEPPKEVADMMGKSDVALLVTTYSLSHTQARKQACEAGCRIASLPGITVEMIIRTLSSDYSEIADLSKKITSLLTAAKSAHLTSKNGTDVVFDLNGRTALDDTGLFTNPGDFGNLPAGEGFIAPQRAKTNGVIVFDGCFADIVLDTPIRVLVEKGQVVDIDGGEAGRLLNTRLSRVGKNGYNIAELGIGTNKMAKLGSELLEVEKVYGTVHVALGNNATFGGEVDVPFHSDGVILDPLLTLDGRIILKDEELCV